MRRILPESTGSPVGHIEFIAACAFLRLLWYAHNWSSQQKLDAYMREANETIKKAEERIAICTAAEAYSTRTAEKVETMMTEARDLNGDTVELEELKRNALKTCSDAAIVRKQTQELLECQKESRDTTHALVVKRRRIGAWVEASLFVSAVLIRTCRLMEKHTSLRTAFARSTW